MLELSPFTVTAQQDSGYRAGGTLSGSRLRTDLRDVANAVSVVTKDFMADVGASNLDDVLVYTLGTEVSGLGGNFSAAEAQADRVVFDSVNRNPRSRTRVRGLDDADATRDFFLSDVPIDGYNTERIEISRGPNAMLFGLGSPGGITNATLIQPRFDRNHTTIESKVGSYGSHRGSLDHSHILMPDRLAVRVAGLLDRQELQQEPAFVKDKRAFLAATFRPFRHTTIRANAEWAERNSNKPRTDPPRDSYSWWWLIGQPTYDPTTGALSLRSTPAAGYPSAATSSGTLVRTQISAWSTGPALILEDPNVAAFGITGTGAMATEARNERVRLNNSGGYVTDGLRSLHTGKSFMQTVNGGSSDPRFAFWKDFQLSDPNVFNFYDEMLDGPNKYEWARWKTYNLIAEQRLFGGNGGIEVAYDKQVLDSGYENPFQGSGYAVTMDINTKLSNGQVNPNLGRAVVADSGWSAANGADREAFRATGFYNLDLNKISDGWLGKLLGRHTFTGSYTDQRRHEESFGGRYAMLGVDYFASEAATFSGTLDINATNNRRVLMSAAYVGPSAIGTSGPTDTRLQGIRVSNSLAGTQTVTVLNYQSPLANSNPRVLANWEVEPFSVIANTRGEVPATGSYTATRTRDRIKSSVLVAQSRWWDGVVVSTLGWRRDAFKTYDAGAAAFDPATGMRITDPSVWSPQLTLDDAETSFNYGVVVHTPEPIQQRLPLGTSVSLTYNESDNFRPTAQRFDLNGDPLSAQSGSTKEYGVLLSVFDGRLELRATHYETASSAATNSGIGNTQNRLVRQIETFFDSIAVGNNSDVPSAVAAWNAWAGTPRAQQLFETFDFQFVRNPDGSVASTTHDDRVGVVVSTSDVVATGMEYEAVINPTRNWRIAVNVARQEAVRSNTGIQYTALLDELEPVWTGAAGALRESAGGRTLSEFFATNKSEVQREVLLDGSPSPELRKWRANVITNYSFSEGRLKGWHFGGAVRWQDRSTIGFPVIVVAGGPQYDVANPYYGPEETNLDAWIGYRRKISKDKIAWHVQLNVKNIGVGNELIPVNTQPDGSIAAWRIAQPQTWTLTNTFEF